VNASVVKAKPTTQRRTCYFSVIVDDNLAVREIVRRVLTLDGYATLDVMT
jgi:hypothetical protein